MHTLGHTLKAKEAVERPLDFETLKSRQKGDLRRDVNGNSRMVCIRPHLMSYATTNSEDDQEEVTILDNPSPPTPPKPTAKVFKKRSHPFVEVKKKAKKAKAAGSSSHKRPPTRAAAAAAEAAIMQAAAGGCQSGTSKRKASKRYNAFSYKWQYSSSGR